MKLTDAPDKIVLPFADAGLRNTIPVESQIPITPGAASFEDGFPPITMDNKAAGGLPPDGLDMNGVLYDATASNRWSNAGAGYPYDSTFATDTNVGGYPAGATVVRTDGVGYWLNTVDDNTTDPEAGGAGWVPAYAYGSSAITMTNVNVTLTSLQAGKPVITITGTLTGNLNLIFPAIYAQWLIRNNTTGSYSITCKTASGTGVVVPQSQPTLVACDATNVSLAVSNCVLKSGDTMTGALAMSGAPVNEAQGSNIASASTINLTTATGNSVHVTGTTTITAITLAQGYARTVVFDDALTLTNGASLILPSGANITTAAGDVAMFRGEGSGVVRCEVYARASGLPVADLGVGQTWQNVTASRAANTNYTNSTDKPIMVSIYKSGGTDGYNLQIDGITVGGMNNESLIGSNISAIVPAGSVYKFSSTFDIWAELR